MAADTRQKPFDERIDALLDFWFDGYAADADALRRLGQRWFAATPADDADLRQRFGPLAAEAARGALDVWADTPRGRLALILLLDQLPRNLYRGTRDAFAGDASALELCLEGLDLGHDAALDPLERIFFCMPLQHAESRAIQALSVETFEKLAEADLQDPITGMLQGSADSAREHHAIVDRFGRFPHRNKALGRKPTEAELEFLGADGSSFGQ